MTEKKLQRLIEHDLMQLKLLLKLRAASYSVIGEQERQHIRHFHDTLQIARILQHHLQQELLLIKRLRNRQEKNHKTKRWNIIHSLLIKEIAAFQQSLRNKQNFVASCRHLHARLHAFNRVLRIAQRKTLKGEEIHLLKAFSKAPSTLHIRD